ncbi:MAG: polysaccharide pyruvyl transferase family protein [Nitrososphaerota archaeon]
MGFLENLQPYRGKRAFIRGYYGYRNIGDEAMLHVLVIKLKKAGIEVIVASKDPKYIEKVHNVKAVYSGPNLNFVRAFLSSDILIEGPGNKHGFLSIIDFGLPLVAKMLRKEVWYIGVGLNPQKWKRQPTYGLKGDITYGLLKQFALRYNFNNIVSVVLVRDEFSREFLVKCGVEDRKIGIIRDLAYFLEVNKEVENKVIQLLSDLGVDINHDKIIGISVRQFKNECINKYLAEQICNTIKRVCAALPSAKFIFIPFSLREGDNDLEFVRKLKVCMPTSSFKSKILTFIPTEMDPKLIKGVIKFCSFLIGVRYHSQIFAESYGIPFVAIIYDPKSEDVSKKAIFRFYVNNFDGEKVASKIIEVFTKHDSGNIGK